MARDDEKIAVVDKDNNIIGYKVFADMTDKDTWRIVSVWVENSQGQILLQQRSFDKTINPGLWSPAAEGTVEGDDDYLSTAMRELEEEIGLHVTALEPIKLVLYKSSFGSRWCQYYRAVCDWPLEKFKAQKEEVAQLAWTDKKHLLEEIRTNPSKFISTAYLWPDLFNLV